MENIGKLKSMLLYSLVFAEYFDTVLFLWKIDLDKSDTKEFASWSRNCRVCEFCIDQPNLDSLLLKFLGDCDLMIARWKITVSKGLLFGRDIVES